jgi:hypothetical protein
MCNSKFNSALFALSGFGTSYAMHRLHISFWNYMTILFYAGMELLQFVQHFVLDECDNKVNVYSTHIAWIYIWLQPLLWNIQLYKTCHKKNNKKVILYNLLLSSIVFILAMDRHFWFILHNGYVRTDEISAGLKTCTFSGNKHLKWKFYLQTNNGFEVNYIWYFVLNCLPAFWAYGILQGFIYNIIYLSGIGIGLFVCNGCIEEVISYWCFISIPYLLINVAYTLSIKSSNSRFKRFRQR